MRALIAARDLMRAAHLWKHTHIDVVSHKLRVTEAAPGFQICTPVVHAWQPMQRV